MRSIRQRKAGPKMPAGKHCFITRGSRMGFRDKPVKYCNAYYAKRFEADFNAYSKVWETTIPMVSSGELRMIYEIENYGKTKKRRSKSK